MALTQNTYGQAPNANPEKNLLSAKPAPILIDPLNTALIVVDMQNDFGTKGGMFALAGLDISIIEKVIPPTGRVISAARQAGIKIIYLKMGYQADLSDLGKEGSPNRVRHLQFKVGENIQAPDGTPSRVLIRDTWNTDIVAELKPHPGDIVMYKTRYSGFYKTDLDALLQQNHIKNLIFTGCTTSVCVESTVRDAHFRDYSAVVLEDCTAEPMGHDFPRSNHEASLLVIQALFGWVSNSEAFLKTVQVPAGDVRKKQPLVTR